MSERPVGPASVPLTIVPAAARYQPCNAEGAVWNEHRNLHMAGNEVVDHLASAPIWHESQLDACELLEPFADDVLVNANTRRGIVHSRVSSDARQKFGERTRSERMMNGEHKRLASELADRRQVLDGIEVQLECVLRTRHAIARDKDGVAIGHALGDGFHARGATGTRPIVHYQLLAKDARQMFGDKARYDVCRAAGYDWQDETYRPSRISFRAGNAPGGRKRGRARGQMQKSSAGKFHFEPPFTSFDHLVGE